MLAKIPELKVIGRTSSFSFKGKNEDLRTIAEKLGVAHILEGSVRKSGNTVRITAQLINAIDGTHLWSETYDRNMDDIFKVQDEIAGAVVSQLKVALLVPIQPATQNPEAYNLYLQGKYFADRRGKENYALAIEKYKLALAIDSNSAPAWAGLAFVYISQVGSGDVPVKVGFTQAREAVQQALQIDPLLSEAFAVQGRIYWSYDWDWAKADESTKRALELAPGNAASLLTAGRLALNSGRFDKAIALLKQSIAIEPLRAYTYIIMAQAHYYAGNFPEAEAASRKALELNPASPVTNYRLAMVQLEQGKYEAALESILKEPHEGWRFSGLPLVYYKLNRKAESDAALKELITKYSQEGAYQVAEAYAYRGEIDLAFQWLERAYQQRDPGLTEMKVSRLLKNLHSDARWLPFLKKMKLAE